MQNLTLREARKQAKDLGFVVKIQTLSWGPHASIVKAGEGKLMPTIFPSETARLEWLPIIEWLKTVESVTHNGKKVYGFQK